MVKINIRMPDNCQDCPCMNEETYCQAKNKPLNSETYNKRRPRWCPLISDETGDAYASIGKTAYKLLEECMILMERNNQQ